MFGNFNKYRIALFLLLFVIEMLLILTVPTNVDNLLIKYLLYLIINVAMVFLVRY